MSDLKIVVVEDERKLAKLIIDYLKVNGFEAIWFPSGDAAVKYLLEHTASLVLLDVMLPGGDGFQVCQQIRETSPIPIIMVTSRGQEDDRLKGFDVGVDDYICKPFSPKELISRIKAVLRRSESVPGQSVTGSPVLRVAPEAYTATINDQLLDLTPQEFRILLTLFKRPGKVFTRSELFDGAYLNDSGSNDRAIDSHIKNLRRKFKLIDERCDFLKSVYGVGYKLEI